MSLGAADSITIVASSMQVARFVAALLIGPALARHLSRRMQTERGTATAARL